ncbi:hypothetical protein JAAARDRAFT_29835 [Jaapia argillacea MUCL 33604]|uniref:Uncharacterized protein n=1 Tax=Jaapia argillacea MUCL 33604 TaxID=933084 RepID=A0A067Q9Q9_9AGAM|nr:hypothetical protein JAAARDRAFT_29835 [Jaapia argillacea MUCL 33604]
MATTGTEFKSLPSVEGNTIDSLVNSVTKVSVKDDNDDSDESSHSSEGDSSVAPKPPIVYTRSELLLLHKSPLVKEPDGMPALRDWFGDWNEQTSTKKDVEASSTSASTRRFRRDAEDAAELPTRPQFRSALSQPSQMGNFKHQSIRAGDRDRDRETDKERDKEGLRNLSDKFDRDRLALPATSTIVRNRERDAAPHLNSTSTRSSTGPQAAANGSRRTETTRDATRRRIGEVSDDWRRASDFRGGRDERPEGSRRERDDRERPRSRVRDSSRRRESSVPRREARDRDDRERGGEREREKDRDKERDRRLDRDRDGDDDPRRWRDDGKRDERLAARRDRDRGRDGAWEGGSERYRERGDHWTPADEKDARPKRSSGRERRLAGDDGKDRDDRRDREKEREKEKEPAWMETYIPTGASAGILGGKSSDGELDGIQAWKRGMKEKEQREKTIDNDSTPKSDSPKPVELEKTPVSSTPPAGEQGTGLDEIQLFKMLMRKEEAKRKVDGSDGMQAEPSESAPGLKPSEAVVVSGAPTFSTNGHTQESRFHSSHNSPSVQTTLEPSSVGPEQRDKIPPHPHALPTPNTTEEPRSRLALMIDGPGHESMVQPPKLPTPSGDISRSRLFPNPPSEGPTVSPMSTLADKASLDRTSSSSPASAHFNPPQGSRLLAFGMRNASAIPSHPPVKSQSPVGHSLTPRIDGYPPPGMPLLSSGGYSDAFGQPTGHSNPGPDSDFVFQPRSSFSESSQAQKNFSAFDDRNRLPVSLDHTHDPTMYTPPLDHLRRASVASASERSQFGSGDVGMAYNDFSGRITPGQSGIHLSNQMTVMDAAQGANGMPSLNNTAAPRGSRFAKFFDAKTRDSNLSGASGSPVHGGSTSSPGLPNQRQEFGIHAGNSDRTMEELVAMLNNSAQTQRVTGVNGMNPLHQLPGGFNPPHSTLQSLSPQHFRPQQQGFFQNRLDSLPEHRLDDRGFMPDGMVPGLRLPRNREPSVSMLNDQLEDHLQFNMPPRLPQQQRPLDHVYSPSASSGYPHQSAILRNPGLPSQQTHFRGGPSPIANQGPLHAPGQRIPPGLAHLGGRPPHDTSQFIGGPGMGSGLPGGPHNNGPSPPFAGVSSVGLGLGGGPQMRLQPPGAHHMQAQLALQNGVTGLNHPGNLDVRGPHQGQMLGLGGGLRGSAPAFGPPHGVNTPIQAPHLAMRHQQPQHQHLSHQLLPAHVPPHLQQQGLPSANSQPQNDLMALLMGGSRRD